MGLVLLYIVIENGGQVVHHFFYKYLFMYKLPDIKNIDMKDIWEKIKNWAKQTALPWLQKAWLQIVNVIIVLFAYGQLDSIGATVAAGIVGFWGFILLAYWIFWKFFGMDKVVKAYIAQKKK